MKNLAFITVLLIASCSLLAQSNNEKALFTGKITILHTNDMHGNFSRFPRLAFVVDSIRNVHKHVLLLNAGDIFTGNPLVDMNKEKGFQMMALMNKAGYDLSVFGNHEFDYGQEILTKRMSEANFPFICANIWNTTGAFQLPKPFVSIKIDNSLNINIIGLLDNSANGKPETHPKRIEGLVFTNPIETAKKFEHLKSCSNLFIALSHLGAKQDVELAKNMSSLDLIVGGHSHTKIDSLYLVNGVMVTQAASHLKCLGEISIEFVDGKIVNKTMKLIELNKNGSIDTEIKELINKYEQNPMFAKVIGRTNNDIKGKEELGSLFTDAIRAEANLDIAFQNSGGLRISKLPKGDIKMGQIFKLDPFGNYLMTLKMNVKEIKSLIKSAFQYGETDLKVSGMHYTLTIEDGKIKDIQLTDYQDNELNEDKSYTVGMNDYILSSYQFEHKDIAQSFGATTAEVIISYLKKQRSVDYKDVKRTFVKKK